MSPGLSLSAGVRSTWVERSAGERPNRIPESIETVAAKPNTRRSGDTLKLIGQRPLAMKATSMFVPQKARITLAAPPKAAKSRPSVSSCRTSRPRRAPIARRTEISFCRDLLRASSRLATLAQAISRTSPATVIRMKSGFENSLRR